MGTIFFVYLISEGLLLVCLAIMLLTVEPSLWIADDESRFFRNWKEGGNILFVLSWIVSLLITAAVVKVMLWGKILDAL